MPAARRTAAALAGIALLGLLSACSAASPAAERRPSPAAPRLGAALTATEPPTPSPSPAPPTSSPTPIQLAPPAESVPTAGATPPPDAAPATAGTGPSRVVEYGESGRREIALTFDAGSDRGNAEAILDLLRAEGITASFGMMGQWAEANPDLVRRMVAKGHMLFNHSWSHASFTGATTQTAPLTAAQRLDELSRTEAVVRELTGYDLRPYFRPPYGDYDDGVLADLAAAGYGVTVLWSCDSRDSLGATADEIIANCIEDAAPGRIVLLHVGAQSAASEALPRMIASLREQGFAFVTVEQILQP